jgi:hypothetical protein
MTPQDHHQEELEVVEQVLLELVLEQLVQMELQLLVVAVVEHHHLVAHHQVQECKVVMAVEEWY